MALQTVRSGATAHPEEMIDFLLSHFIYQSGVKSVADGDLEVVEQDTPAMAVDVSTGYAFIAKEDESRAYPVRLYSAAEAVSVTSNSSGNPRKDAIVLYINLGATPNSTATNVASLACVAGTPAPSPTSPTDGQIQTAIGASYPFIRLADVSVASGATEILTANILDTRPQAYFKPTLVYDVATKTGSETLTNKTLTSPVINTPTGDVVTLTGSQVLTNKTLTTPVVASVYQDVGKTKLVTMPAATDILVGKATSDTLTNKVMVAKHQTYTPSGAGTTTLDLSLGGVHTVTMPATTQTLAITNATVGQYFIVNINNVTGQGALTWFSTIRWADGVTPTLTGTNGKRDKFGFEVTGSGTYDGTIISQNH